MIWEYVLTSPTALHSVGLDRSGASGANKAHHEMHTIPASASTELASDGKRDFNVLKRVNRQMYYETTRLELKYNDIQFSQDTTEETVPLQQLVVYVSRLRNTQVAWLSNVILVSHRTVDPFTTFKPSGGPSDLPVRLRQFSRWLLAFFKHNPRINIKIYDPTFHFRPEDPPVPLLMGYILTTALRGKKLTSLYYHRKGIGNYVEWLTDRLASASPEIWLTYKELGVAAPKLRIFPIVTGTLEDWQQAMDKNYYGPDYENVWAKQGKEWVEHGI